ncbi:trigger factor [Plectonema cf. radiosum LEGE 06105]|uniref:Trigger factor n=1 Tax=Plectonema cf. radiosum LEGE 06105 TaxID=945769 RepID=A0A8J7K3I9_9CYAN|nr:trigger factor [Plectonema radiosum]MBE9214227.1 trigger factor [Plectonema cf. radiosum LEGE 06105]
MKVTQEKLPASRIGIEIEIAPEKTKQTYEKVIQNYAREANISGFRKGKVPRQILLQRLGKTRIKAAALEELIQNGIEEAIKQESIEAIGQPELRSSFEELINNYEPGQPLTFSAAVDVPPQVNLGEYSGLQFKAEEVKYDPQQVDQVLDGERVSMATLIPVEGRPAQLGDTSIIDFKGFLAATEGEEKPSEELEAIPGAEATDFQVDLEEDKFIPGFIAGIVGMNPGETKEILAQFPDPYANEELAGKAALFTVTLKELKEKELPEINDDFAQEISEFETLEELRNSLEERFKKEVEDNAKAKKQEALLNELVKHVTFDLPETMIQQEVDAMITQTAMRLSQQGLDIKKLFNQDTIPQLRERSRPEAIDRIKRTLALREIGDRESIKASEEEIEARKQEVMEQYAEQDVDPDRVQSVVENELLTEKIIDWLLERSSIELVPEGSLNPQETVAPEETIEPQQQENENDSSTEEQTTPATVQE